MFLFQKGRSFFWITFNGINPIFLQMYLDVMIETFEDVIGIDVDIAIYRRYRQHHRFCNSSLSVDINIFILCMTSRSIFVFRMHFINIDIDGDVVKLCTHDIVDVNNKNGHGHVYIIFGCFFFSRFCLGKYIAKCYSLMYKKRYVYIKTRQF